jgi:hypothetical protein
LVAPPTARKTKTIAKTKVMTPGWRPAGSRSSARLRDGGRVHPAYLWRCHSSRAEGGGGVDWWRLCAANTDHISGRRVGRVTYADGNSIPAYLVEDVSTGRLVSEFDDDMRLQWSEHSSMLSWHGTGCVCSNFEASKIYSCSSASFSSKTG